jgi:hypothetical protein
MIMSSEKDQKGASGDKKIRNKKHTGEGSVQTTKHGELKLSFQAVPSVASKHFAVTHHTVGKLAVVLTADQCNGGELICLLCQMNFPPRQVSSG